MPTLEVALNKVEASLAVKDSYGRAGTISWKYYGIAPVFIKYQIPVFPPHLEAEEVQQSLSMLQKGPQGRHRMFMNQRLGEECRSEGGRDGGREGRRTEGGRKGATEGRREGQRDGGRKGRREGGTEGGRKGFPLRIELLKRDLQFHVFLEVEIFQEFSS